MVYSLVLKIRYSEEATKLEKTFPPYFEITSKQSGRFFQVFVAFSVNLIFTNSAAQRRRFVLAIFVNEAFLYSLSSG